MGGINLSPGERAIDRIVHAIRQIMQGRNNACGTVTLTENDTTTSVAAVNCAADSKIFLTPITADAAAELAAGGLYVSAVANGSFTLTHANDTSTDRTFFWTAQG